RRLGHVLDTLDGPGRPLDAVHLGGGALTLPRYLAVTRPGSRQQVVEADGALLDLVTAHLPLPADCDVTLHTADARAWLEAAPADSAAVIVADVFGGSRVRAHLTPAAPPPARRRLPPTRSPASCGGAGGMWRPARTGRRPPACAPGWRRPRRVSRSWRWAPSGGCCAAAASATPC